MYAVNKRTAYRIRGTYERLHGVAEGAEDSYRRNYSTGTSCSTTRAVTDGLLGRQYHRAAGRQDRRTSTIRAATVTLDDFVLVEQLHGGRQVAMGVHPLLRDRPDSNR